jgi:hypothetical protein
MIHKNQMEFLIDMNHCWWWKDVTSKARTISIS